MELPHQPISTSPTKSVRLYCLSCCCESSMEVKLCPAIECPLHPFRMGKNPYRKTKTLTEEQKQRMAEGRERFNLSKSIDNQSKINLESLKSVMTYPSASLEESDPQEGENDG